MSKLAPLTLALGLALSGVSIAASAQETAAAVKSEPAKVIYHINDSAGQALAALRNMRNHLDVAPDTKIIAVTHAEGIDFLMTDYKDADKVGPLVSALASRGVHFEVCKITLKGRGNLSEDAFMMEAEFVPSGVARIAQLQTQEGYAYIQP